MKSDSTFSLNSEDPVVLRGGDQNDSIAKNKRKKIDGVAAVVGEFLILYSDIAKMRISLENRGISKNMSDCKIMSRLMENKLYAHAAKNDTTVQVPRQRISRQTNQQIQRMKQELGSKEKLLEFYRKESIKKLKKELNKINKENLLQKLMKDEVVKNVEITPQEVHKFFKNIPKNERPQIGKQVEIAQIVIRPEVPQEQIDKVIGKLRDIRADIVENGVSFAVKAVLYSEDRTSTKGGRMTITRSSPVDKTFKQIAFSLREGEVSQPFESAFGYHILKVNNIRGKKRDIQHIILIPRATDSTVQDAKEKLDSIRNLITTDKISFKKAARKFSDDEKTRGDGGQLINPKTNTMRFEMTKLPPLLYSKVNKIEKGEVSTIISDQTKTGKPFFKIITVTDVHPSHIAEYSKDYPKIKELALTKKKLRKTKEWQRKMIEETYIKINGKYRNCDFKKNWLRNK